MRKFVFILWLVCGAAVGFSAPTNDGMYATLQTTMGDVCFELYYTNVPRTVANFVSLTEGTRPWIDPRDGFVKNDPYYNGIIFHRVITNFMIQGGCPLGNGRGGPGYRFEDEFDPALRHDRPGVVSMANSGFDSNGGQFFITLKNTFWLDDVHSVFGSVVEGSHVVSNIAAVVVDGDARPLTDVVITNAFITRNGTNALNFAVTNQSLPEVEVLPIGIDATTGIKVSTETADASFQYIYSSTNLMDWIGVATNYWLVAEGNWVFTATGESREYFRANRVGYTPDTNMTVNPILHRLIMTIDGNVFEVTPDGVDSGGVMVNVGTNSAIVVWDWIREPYRARFVVDSDYYYTFWFDLHYTSLTNGRCEGYYYDGNWYYIGSSDNEGIGTFTDQWVD